MTLSTLPCLARCGGDGRRLPAAAWADRAVCRACDEMAKHSDSGASAARSAAVRLTLMLWLGGCGLKRMSDSANRLYESGPHGDDLR